jgi:hypothetical protein
MFQKKQNAILIPFSLHWRGICFILVMQPGVLCEYNVKHLLKNIKRLVFITEVESVYSAVRAESLSKTDTLRL